MFDSSPRSPDHRQFAKEDRQNLLTRIARRKSAWSSAGLSARKIGQARRRRTSMRKKSPLKGWSRLNFPLKCRTWFLRICKCLNNVDRVGSSPGRHLLRSYAFLDALGNEKKTASNLSIVLLIRIARFQSFRVCFPALFTRSFGVIISPLDILMHFWLIPGHRKSFQINFASMIPHVTLKNSSPSERIW